MACLVNEDAPTSDDSKMAEGVVHVFNFVPTKLEEHRDEVTTMLQNLPLAFRPVELGGGGGWSFLNACQDANDEQWTGLHQRMEQLLCLGIAMGLAEWVLPKDMWPALPGGMPYVVVKV